MPESVVHLFFILFIIIIIIIIYSSQNRTYKTKNSKKMIQSLCVSSILRRSRHMCLEFRDKILPLFYLLNVTLTNTPQHFIDHCCKWLYGVYNFQQEMSPRIKTYKSPSFLDFGLLKLYQPIFESVVNVIRLNRSVFKCFQCSLEHF